MCRFFSGIQTKSGVLFDLWDDSHEDIVKSNKLDDKTREPDFVRLELIPKKEPWNQDPANWELVVDQDTRPSWFSEEFARRDMWEALQKLWKETLILGQELDEVKDRRVRWVVDSKIQKLSGTSQVGEMWGTSRVGEMWDTSRVGEMRDTSRVGVMRGTSRVGEMWDTSQVGEMRDTSRVGEMWDTSQVGEMNDSSFTMSRVNNKPIITTPNKEMKIKIFKPKKEVKK